MMTEDIIQQLRGRPYAPRTLRDAAAKHIESLELLFDHERDAHEYAKKRLAALEAALREIADNPDSAVAHDVARRALEREHE